MSGAGTRQPFEIQLEAQPDSAIGIMAVDELAEPAEVDLVAAELGLVHVDVTVAQDLVGIAKSLEDRALASAVAAEEQGDGPEVDPNQCTDSLEVLDLDGGDQRLLRSGRGPAGRGKYVFSRRGRGSAVGVGAVASISGAVVFFLYVRLDLVRHH